MKVRDIQRVVADYYEISVEDLISRRQSAYLAKPRQIAYWLCRELTNASFPAIASQFGGRDHTTVMYGCRKIDARMATDREFAAEVGFLMAAAQATGGQGLNIYTMTASVVI